MLNKIKNFFKKYKLIILIVTIFFVLLFLILNALLSEEEVSKEHDPFDFDRPAREEREPRYRNYEMSFSDNLIGSMSVFEGSQKTFEILDVDHREWAKDFADSVAGLSFEYSYELMPEYEKKGGKYSDQTIHFWRDGGNAVKYDVQSDLLGFYFESPLNLSGVEVDPKDVTSAQNSLDNISAEFFSSEFEYEVTEVSVDGNYYRVDFARLLNDKPVFLYFEPLYFLATRDGRLKEGRFLLAEFRESGTVEVMSSREMDERINDENHMKSIVLRPTSREVLERYGETFFIMDITGDEEANINLEVGDLVYYYTVKLQEEMVPQFRLNGEGVVDIQGEKIDSTFEVLTDAI